MANLHAELRDGPPGELETPRRALAIGAHPDDVEFGAGGTLARWAGNGCEVTIVVITDGSKGSWDPSVDPADLIAARRSEAERAAATLGAAGIEFLDAVDGELTAEPALKEHLALAIRRHRPDVVLGHDPWQRYQLHPDHRAAGWLTTDAVVAAREPFFYRSQLRDGIEPHRPRAVLLWSPDEPNHWEDIGSTLSVKVAALLCHASQGATTMGNAQEGGAAAAEFEQRIIAWARRAGVPASIETAEEFRRMTP